MATQKQHPAVAAGKGKTVSFLGELITVNLAGEETAGAYAIIEVSTVPQGGPAFLHTHPQQETFYIAEGEYEVYGCNDEGKYAMRAAAGDILHVPGGAPHGFKNIGSTMGRVLQVLEPAGGMEILFVEGGTLVVDTASPPVPAGPPDMERLGRLFEQYKLVFLEPPPIGH